jgi:tRNA (cmo5U34)-methyltransferase
LTPDIRLPIVGPWAGVQVKKAASLAALESAKRDQLVPPAGARWRFDQDVTNVFENMLSRSIPEYDTMRSLVFELGATLVQPGTTIIDIGCSKGDALEPFVRRFGAANHYVGAELSEAMFNAARQRFATQIAQGIVDIRHLDLRAEYPQEMASLTLAVLTVQFIPIEYRQRLMQRIAAHTSPGGGLVFVEKVLGSSAPIGDMLTRRYHALKAAHGYTTEQIERKRLALEGVLVPVAARWNEDLMREAGFHHIECFWRWCNFAGWIALKN